MIDLEQKIRMHREEALQELHRLEAQVEALKHLVKVLDGLLKNHSEALADASKPSPPRKAAPPPRGEINTLVMAACVDWKTPNDLVAEVEGLKDRSKSNISTRCRILWLNGHLDRRDRRAFQKAYAPNGKLIQKEYEYKVREV